jgi:uncharacterized protein YegJ (DUF2314 family)
MDPQSREGDLMEGLRLASFEHDYWQLDSGITRHREAPDTFWIPDEAAREAVTKGDLVKLIFEYDLEPTVDDAFTSERMWVEITDRIDQFYIGSLDNEPRVARERHGLALGSRVVFLAEHIIDID